MAVVCVMSVHEVNKETAFCSDVESTLVSKCRPSARAAIERAECTADTLSCCAVVVVFLFGLRANIPLEGLDVVLNTSSTLADSSSLS